MNADRSRIAVSLIFVLVVFGQLTWALFRRVKGKATGVETAERSFRALGNLFMVLSLSATFLARPPFWVWASLVVVSLLFWIASWVASRHNPRREDEILRWHV